MAENTALNFVLPKTPFSVENSDFFSVTDGQWEYFKRKVRVFLSTCSWYFSNMQPSSCSNECSLRERSEEGKKPSRPALPGEIKLTPGSEIID